MPQLTLWNQTRGTVACRELTLAATSRTRLFGLLGRRSLPSGEGLLIRPSSGVHTFGMLFPIDVVALDRENCVSGVWEAVGPWRVRALSLATRSVLEMSAGEARRAGIQVGDRLELATAPPANA